MLIVISSYLTQPVFRRKGRGKIFRGIKRSRCLVNFVDQSADQTHFPIEAMISYPSAEFTLSFGRRKFLSGQSFLLFPVHREFKVDLFDFRLHRSHHSLLLQGQPFSIYYKYAWQLQKFFITCRTFIHFCKIRLEEFSD